MHKKKPQGFVSYSVFCGHCSAAVRCGRALAAVWLCIVSIAATRADTVVARVDDTTLTADELRLFIGWHKAEVARRFFAAQPVVTEAMWTQPRAGQSAADALRDEALADAIEAKVRQLVYCERGLTALVAFSAIEAEYAAENTRRADALAGHQVVYGPRQWTLPSYYRQRDAELTIRLRELLRADDLAASGVGAVVTPEQLDRQVQSLVRERLKRAHISIDRAALASQPIP